MRVQKVGLTSGPELNVKAHALDTYVAPAAPQTSDIEQIAKAMTKYNPEIDRYLAVKEKDNRDFEEAIGMKMYEMLGPDKTTDEIRELVKSGQAPGFSRFTRNMRNGVIRMQHQAVAREFGQHMQAWELSATLPDKDGNPVALSQVDDRDRVMQAYAAEESRYLQEKTGGQYDPVVWQEESSGIAQAALNTFTQRQISERAMELQRRQGAAILSNLASIIEPRIVNGHFDMDEDQTVDEVTQSLLGLYASGQKNSMSVSEINVSVLYGLESYMHDTRIDNIEILRKVAERLPLWEDPQLQEQFTNRLLQVPKERADAAAVQSEERRARQSKKLGDLLVQCNCVVGDIPPEELLRVVKIAPEGASTLYNTLVSLGNIKDFQFAERDAMDDEQYYELKEQAAAGKVSASTALNLRYSMSERQHQEFMRTWKAADSVETTGNGGSTKGSTRHRMNRSNVTSILNPDFGSDVEDNANMALVVNKITGEVDKKMRIFIQKNPNLTQDEYDDAAYEIAATEIKSRSKEIDLYKNDPKLLDKPAEEVHSDAVKSAKEAAYDRFNTDDKGMVRLLNRVKEAKEQKQKFIPTEDDIKTIVKCYDFPEGTSAVKKRNIALSAFKALLTDE